MMSEHQPPTENRAGSAARPSSVFAFPPPVPLPLGSQTVINPEGRPDQREIQSPHATQVSPASSLCRILFPQPSNADSVPPSPIGLELGHFRIEDRIRSGGMGAVFRALDTRLNRIVALKVLPPGQSRDFASVQRFRNEAQAAAQLDHENIARVFYIGEDHGLHFIAFEFISGTNVRELIEQQGKLDVPDAVNFALQVAAAVAHTSSKGVVHRDIKPSNIVITPGGRAKLVDLGLARNENKEVSEDLTLAGTTLGTFDYISPEQAKDPRAVDVRSDIYSLGCTLYHMLAGEPPYPDGTVLQKLLDHQGNHAPDARRKNRRVSEDLSAIVRKMMASDPRRRYQTPELLIRDLMLVAGSMGLRSVSPEGLVWLNSQAAGPAFWERHVGWLSTVAALLLIVGYLKYSSDPAPWRQWQSRSSEAAPSDAATATSGDPADSPSPRENARSDSGRNVGSGAAANPRLTTPVVGIPIPSQDLLKGGTPQDFTPQAAPPADSGVEVAALRPEMDGGIALGPVTPPESFLKPQPEVDPLYLASGLAAPRPLNSEFAAAPEKPSAAGKGVESPAVASVASVSPPSLSAPPEPGSAAAVTETAPGIYIVGADGSPAQLFRSLKAACAAAVDGSVIELRFNGHRAETPVRITKKVTIRAGRGFRPLLEMVPEDIPAEGFQTRMISVASGSLDLVDVNVLLSVREGVSTDLWALFAVHRPDHVRLQGITLTLFNPKQRPAVVAEFRESPGWLMSDMDLINSNQPRTPVEFELLGSLVRGTGDLLLSKSPEGGRFSLRDSVLALNGTLLQTQGNMELPFDNAQIELRLDHVTAVLNGGLLEMETGELPRKLIPVHVSATNNILSNTAGQVPLVSISGNAPSEDLRRRLQWNGQKNFYDGFQWFWSVNSTDGMGKSGSLDFAEWKKHWGAATEVDAHAEVVIWRRQWSAKPFRELVPGDFALDRTASGNPAISGANNGGDAGVDLGSLERLTVLPLPERPAVE